MSDETPEVQFEEVKTASPWSTYKDDREIIVEGVDEDPEAKSEPQGPSTDELAKELDEIKRQNEELAQKADSNLALQAGIRDLKDSIRQPVVQPAPIQKPGESDAAFADRLKEGLLDDPDKLLDEKMNRRLSPVFDKILSTNLSLQKKLTRIEKGDSFDRYSTEIEQEVQNMDRTDPDVYGKAHDMVVSRHLSDEKERIKQEVIEELKKEQPVPQVAPQNFTPAASGSPPPVNKGKYIKISPEEKAQATREANRRGLDVQKFIQIKYGGRAR